MNRILKKFLQRGVDLSPVGVELREDKPLYKTLYRQVRCGSLRTLLVSINTS